MIVVEASALLEALLQTPAAIAVEERLFDEGLPLHAPHLIDVEVAQVLRRSAATGQIEPTRCRDAVDALQDFPLRRYPHDVLLRRVWELRHNLTAYDAVYVALAEVLDARLPIRDRRFAAAAGIVQQLSSYSSATFDRQARHRGHRGDLIEHVAARRNNSRLAVWSRSGEPKVSTSRVW